MRSLKDKDKDKDKSTIYCLKIKISLKAYLPWDVEVSKPWIFPLVVVTTSSELIFAAAWSDYLDDQSEIINLRIISMIAIRWSGSNISVAAPRLESYLWNLRKSTIWTMWKHGPGKDHQRLYLPRTSVRTAGVERDSDAFLPIKCVMLCLILTVSAAVNTSLLRNTTRTVGCPQMIAGSQANFYNLTRYFVVCSTKPPLSPNFSLHFCKKLQS